MNSIEFICKGSACFIFVLIKQVQFFGFLIRNCDMATIHWQLVFSQKCIGYLDVLV